MNHKRRQKRILREMKREQDRRRAVRALAGPSPKARAVQSLAPSLTNDEADLAAWIAAAFGVTITVDDDAS